MTTAGKAGHRPPSQVAAACAPGLFLQSVLLSSLRQRRCRRPWMRRGSMRPSSSVAGEAPWAQSPRQTPGSSHMALPLTRRTCIAVETASAPLLRPFYVCVAEQSAVRNGASVVPVEGSRQAVGWMGAAHPREAGCGYLAERGVGIACSVGSSTTQRRHRPGFGAMREGRWGAPCPAPVAEQWPALCLVV